jgi:hypothetical protein
LAILVAAAHVSTGGRGSFSSLAIAGSSILAIAWILMNQRHAVALVAPADRERRHLQYVQDQPARIDAPDGAGHAQLAGASQLLFGASHLVSPKPAVSRWARRRRGMLCLLRCSYRLLS